MKYSNVRGGAVLVFGLLCAVGLSDHANAGWGHRHGSYGGSSGVYGVGYGSSGAYSSYGSSGYGSSGYTASYASSGYAASYGSSGYAASYGSSGYYGSSGRPTLGQRIHAHMAAKRARHAARRASYGSSGYYASSGGSTGYSSTGGSSGYSSYSYSSTGGSSGSYATPVYSGGSSGSVYSSGVSYGSAGAVSSGYYSSLKPSASSASSIVSTRVNGDAVYLTVAVPSNAKVFVNGKPTSSTGRVREFVSRGLKAGSSYKFEIRADLESVDGQVMSESKNLVVRAGAREQIQFAFADQAKPIETAVTVNVPENAQVFLAGNPTSASGATRTFRTSKLMPGQSWDEYDIEVHHGDQVKQKSIRLKAGDQLQLTFAFDDIADPSKLASR